MKFSYNCTVVIIVNGKIVETFINKRTTPCCETIMSRFVCIEKGYTEGSFELMKM